MKWTTPLADLTPRDRRRIGGKAVGLIELGRLGSSVPAAFVLTTDAFERFAADRGLDGDVDRLLRSDRAGRERLGWRLRERVRSASVEPSVASEVHEAVRVLSAGIDHAVAVRSSSIAEDGASTSYAGQFHTTLGVRGEAHVESAIVRCWASLFSPAAIEYLAGSTVGSEEVSMAVVIQLMVSATASGVMFTTDPRAGDPSQLVIEATAGLGPPLVSGRIDPDRFVVDKVTLALRSETIGAKQHVLELDAQAGTVRMRVAGSPAIGPCLDDDDVLAIAQAGIDVERALGRPMDIEWAQGRVGADQGLFMLQARPAGARPDAPRSATPRIPSPVITPHVPSTNGPWRVRRSPQRGDR